MCGIHLFVSCAPIATTIHPEPNKLIDITNNNNDDNINTNEKICTTTTTTTNCNDASRTKTCLACNSSSTRGNPNVQRRGPTQFQHRMFQIKTSNKNNNNNNEIKQYQHAISLQASVLQMRKQLIQQPVEIESLMSSSPSSSYLCWNGEVYQLDQSTQYSIEQQEEQCTEEPNSGIDVSTANTTSTATSTTGSTTTRPSSRELQDVWYFDRPDTQLVADQLKQVLHSSTNQSNNNSNSVEVLGKIANLFGSFLNAEFAFVLVTNYAIYYGRDSWGRRSLLRYDCSNCHSFQVASVVGSIAPISNPSQQEQHPTTTIETTTTDASIAELDKWVEIVPGQVAEYRFDTQTFTSIYLPSPCRRQTELLSKSLSSLWLNSLTTSTIVPPPDGVSFDCWKASYILQERLTRAVAMRLDYDDQRPTAVLFSGGLDSVVLAAIAIQLASSSSKQQQSRQPKVVLSNVSFGQDYCKSADRQAAIISYQTLQELFPNERILYEDIMVSWEDIQQNESHIRTLLTPKSTVMDLNIATALWFASRGLSNMHQQCKSYFQHELHQPSNVGQQQDKEADTRNQNEQNECDMDRNITDIPSSESYNPPRVLLLGMGADEQMGGYGRHRKAFMQHGKDGLRQELILDKSRLWERNLGRDDRICSDHGKEARFPYLDYHVVKLLQTIPVDWICNFTLPPGQGDKQILRLIALRLGLFHASGLVKRAIQFGSRISHLSDTKRFGSRRKAQGQLDSKNK